MNVRIVVAYAVMSAIWGTTWLAIKVALSGFPPLGGAGVRFIIAGLMLYAAAPLLARRGSPKPPLDLILVLAASLFGFNYALTYYSETHLASGLVAVVFGTMPFFVFGLGALILGERVNLRTIAGAALALLGVVVISLTTTGGELIYLFAALGATLLSSYGNVYLKRYADCDPFLTLPPAMLIAGAAQTAAGAILTPIDLRSALMPAPIVATLYLAIFGSGVAFYLNHWLLQRLPTWIVSIEALIVPVIAVAVGALFARETFGTRELIGAALVVAGVWIALAQREPDLPHVASGSITT